MHGPTLSILVVFVVATAAVDRPAAAAIPDAAAQARRRIGLDDGAGAVAILEDALPGAVGQSKDEILVLLRQAYEVAAKKADSAGRAREAETFRENLRILSRKPRSGPAPAPSPTPPEPLSVPTPPSDPPATIAEPAPIIRPEPEMSPASAPVAPADLGPKGPTPAEAPTPTPSPLEAMRGDAGRADAAFAAENYAEAGRIYAELAAEKRLPNNRRDHWAYCRSIDVARRINARPKTDAEWASIDAEIEQIRALNPNNWLGEYLRNRAAERLASGKKAKPGKTVVRGSSPEEPPAARTASNVAPAAPSRVPSPAVVPPVTASPARPAGVASGRWAIRDSANFRVFHADPALAEKVIEAAEATRRDQGRRWGDKAPAGPWQPRCEIYLYPTARQYAAETGQPEDSPGFSTMGMNEGRIISRRLNLRGDHPTLLAAVLPHEVTHVILADHFTTQQIPRWADEGMAVLSEPTDEQDRRASDLVEPLGKNVLFPVETLMSMDYPDNRYWALYYAQSVSLTRFLVEQGTPAQLVQFLQGSQRNGFEAELKRVYQIEGFPDLQARWVAYARNTATPRTAATARPETRVR